MSKNPPWINDIHVNSWSELLNEVHSPSIIPNRGDQGGHYRSPYVFRGMSDSTWGLETSLERLNKPIPPSKVIEYALLRSFQKYASEGIFTKESAWEVLSVAQHNGLPTRVLDWSVSPLIAAHFATSERDHYSCDGVIWCVDVIALRDQVLPASISSVIQNEHAAVFDTQLLQKAYKTLETFDETAQEEACIFFEPPSLDARIANQFGLLSMMNSCSGSHDKYFRDKVAEYPNLVKRIVIDKTAKSQIRDMLDQNNINERMLFPGLPGLCDWLRRYYGSVLSINHTQNLDAAVTVEQHPTTESDGDNP